METVCHNQLIFESLFSKEVIADLAGGRITSDAGGLLLRVVDQRYRIAEKAAACLHDPRDSGKIKHNPLTLVRQRLFAIALGYEDNNDDVWLAKDPALKIMAGKAASRREEFKKRYLELLCTASLYERRETLLMAAACYQQLIRTDPPGRRGLSEAHASLYSAGQAQRRAPTV